jgi:hypothetical protein
MRFLFDLLKLFFLGALAFSMFKCDDHLKDKYGKTANHLRPAAVRTSAG